MKNKWEDSLSTLSVGQQFAQKVKEDARKDKIRRYAPLILLIIMTVIGAISQKNFFSWGNVVNIMYQMSIPLVISTGLMYVLLLGSIDLSIEGVMGFAGSFVAFLVVNNSNDNDFGILGIFLVVLISTAVGALTGFLHVRARIATFIVSYAMGCIMTGAAVLVYRGTPIQAKDELFNVLSQGMFLGIPYLTLIAFAIFIIGALILNYTAFGLCEKGYSGRYHHHCSYADHQPQPQDHIEIGGDLWANYYLRQKASAKHMEPIRSSTILTCRFTAARSSD